MKITSEKINNDFHRDTYWTRIFVDSDNGIKKTVVLVCASYEFLWDRFKTRNFDNAKLSEWLESVEEEIKSMGDGVFSLAIRYKVYATTHEGEKNGLEFLEKEVIASFT